MIKVWHISEEVGYGGNLIYNLTNNAKTIPEPLPWIDPSINCLYKEAVLSFVIGNYESTIMDLCLLLEHVLRAAVLNNNDTGMNRKDSNTKLSKYNSLSDILNDAKNTNIMNGCDIEWWEAVSKVLRNKSAHYVLPILLKSCAKEEKLRKYIDEYELPEANSKYWYESHLTNWGSFYHSAGKKIAEEFLTDATIEIKTVINNTNWNGDESWWISLKQQYDSFFSYEWTKEKLIYSFENAQKELGK